MYAQAAARVSTFRFQAKVLVLLFLFWVGVKLSTSSKRMLCIPNSAYFSFELLILLYGTMSDIILQFLLQLITSNPTVAALPLSILILASWRVARIRGLGNANYQDRVTESVADTLTQEIMDALLRPLFQQAGIQIPQGPAAYDIVLQMVEGLEHPNDLTLLSSIYSSLAQLGAQSPFYAQAVQVAAELFGAG